MLTKQKIDASNSLRLTHRLLHGYYGIPLDLALNLAVDGGSFHAADFSPEKLFHLARVLEGEAVLEEGRLVDYSRLRLSPTYTEFQAASRQLHYFDPASLQDQNQKLSFWINLYNVLILDAVIQFEVSNSVQDVSGFFWKAAYSIGGLRYSAHDIEHGILRANSPHPAIPGRHFGPQDRRRSYSLRTIDPRVHFALNCASKSCPPISVYDTAAINDQLDLAARSFINLGGVEFDSDNHKISLSKIFQWYAPDFGASFMALGSTHALLDFITPYIVDDNQRRFIMEDTPKVKFLPYNWKLNKIKGL